MPEWLTYLFLAVELSAFGVVSWTWYQALLNWRAVTDVELRQFAGVKLVRESILWLLQATITLAFLLVAIFPEPRSGAIRATVVLLLLGVSLGIAMLSFHDFREMRDVIDQPSNQT